MEGAASKAIVGGAPIFMLITGCSATFVSWALAIWFSVGEVMNRHFEELVVNKKFCFSTELLTEGNLLFEEA